MSKNQKQNKKNFNFGTECDCWLVQSKCSLAELKNQQHWVVATKILELEFLLKSCSDHYQAWESAGKLGEVGQNFSNLKENFVEGWARIYDNDN